MKCFTYHDSLIVPSISLVTNEKYGKVIFLGEEGRGKKFKMISLDIKNPADVIDGCIISAFPKTITTETKEKDSIQFMVLSKPYNNSETDKIFIRINTSVPNPTKRSNGGWNIINGYPIILATAHGGRTVRNVQSGNYTVFPRWTDDLVIMRNKDAIRIIPEGGTGDEMMALINNEGMLELTPYCDYNGPKKNEKRNPS